MHNTCVRGKQLFNTSVVLLSPNTPLTRKSDPNPESVIDLNLEKYFLPLKSNSVVAFLK